MRYLWVVAAVLSATVYFIGGMIEAGVVEQGGRLGWSQAAPSLISSASLACLAVSLYRGHARSGRFASGLAVLPKWQGYGVAVLSIGWFTLAGVTWFLTDLKSPFLVSTFVIFGLAHVAGGVGAVRQHREPVES